MKSLFSAIRAYFRPVPPHPVHAALLKKEKEAWLQYELAKHANAGIWLSDAAVAAFGEWQLARAETNLERSANR